MRIEGAENLHAAIARGQGVILLTAHFTSLEMAGRTLLAIAPVKFLYRPTKNEVLAYALNRFRTGYGGRPIPHDDIRAFIGALKQNECVWYAPDQSYRKKGAEMVPLFGIPAATNTLTSRLARMTGAAVLPYFLQRLPGAQGYLAIIHPPLENFPSDCSVSDTERFNRMIEAQVRIVPEQYLWIHRRFKGLTAGLPGLLRPSGAAPGLDVMRPGSCDLLVVGGGVNGTGIARDAAGRGLKVLLCEQDDLAAHTSSASTKLIHGGLRYLEEFHFSLVRKALREREVLLSSAPHIMRPLHFVMPHDAHLRPAWMIRAGLFLYDHLGAPRASGRLRLDRSAYAHRRRPAASRATGAASSIPTAGWTMRAWWC